MAKMNKHIIITCPNGACGTTLLMKILTKLNFDTGFEPEDPSLHEWPVWGKKASDTLEKRSFPYIIKDNRFCSSYYKDRIDKWGWDIDHLYLLVRDINDLVDVKFEHDFGKEWWEENYTQAIEKYKNKLRKMLGNALFQCIEHSIPFSVLEYPHYAKDPHYTYKKLNILMQSKNISYDQFEIAFNHTVDISLLRRRNQWLSLKN